MGKSVLERLVGKVVGLYSEDTYYKYGIIKEVDDLGILVEITKAHLRSGYKSGEVRFISHSNKITLKRIWGDTSNNNY